MKNNSMVEEIGSILLKFRRLKNFDPIDLDYAVKDIMDLIYSERNLTIKKVEELECDVEEDWTGNPKSDGLWHEGSHYQLNRVKKLVLEILKKQ